MISTHRLDGRVSIFISPCIALCGRLLFGVGCHVPQKNSAGGGHFINVLDDCCLYIVN